MKKENKATKETKSTKVTTTNKYTIEISNVHAMPKGNKLLAFFSAKINDILILNGLKLFENEEEYFICSSNKEYLDKNGNKKYSNDYYINDTTLEESICEAILNNLNGGN